MAGITDEQYFGLADEVYKNKYLKKGKSIYTKEVSGKYSNWRVINYVDKPGSGLQAIAVVPAKDYKKGKTDYDNVVFASRGSETSGFSEFVKDWVQTDFGKMGIGMKPQDGEKVRAKYGKKIDKLANTMSKVPGFGVYQLASWYVNSDNQFAQYQTFVSQTLKQYNVKDCSFTGHSLGGALAQFMAVQLKKNAVTYAAANPYRLLSKEQQAAVKNGDFEGLIMDYRHRLHPSENRAE